MVSALENNQVLTGLTITIANVIDGADEILDIDGTLVILTNTNTGTTITNGLTYAVSLSGNTATVVLTDGALSTVQTQTLVDSLSYQNSSVNPTEADRLITLTQLVDSGGLDNGGDDTATLSNGSTVSVLSVNNEPTLTAIGSDPLFTEGGGAASLFNGAIVSAVESGQTLSGLSLTVSNVTDATDELLTIDGSSVSLINSNSGTTATNSLTYAVSLSDSTATVVLSNASLSSAQMQTLIDSMSYQNNSIDPTPVDRLVMLTQLVDSGGIANGGNDTAALNVTSIVQLVAINNEQIISINTGAAMSEGAVDTVIDASMLKTTDEDHSASELVYSLLSNPLNGSLQLNGLELVVNNRFTQLDIDNGAVSFDHDGSDFSTAGFEFSVDDGVGAASAGQFDITVANVNDNDPQADDEQFSVVEGGIATEADLIEGLTLLVGDFDQDLPNDQLTIDTTPVVGPDHGSLILNNDGTFIYTHDGSETLADSFSYALQDSDGGAVGVGRVTIDVIPVNDAPALLNNELTIEGGQTLVLSNANISAEDMDNILSELLFTVSDTTGGHFELSQEPGTIITEFSQEQIALGQVLFISEPDLGAAGFNVSVSDGEFTDGPFSTDVQFEPRSAEANTRPAEITLLPTIEPIKTSEAIGLVEITVDEDRTEQQPGSDVNPATNTDQNLTAAVAPASLLVNTVSNNEITVQAAAEYAHSEQVVQGSVVLSNVGRLLTPIIDLAFEPFVSSLDNMRDGINNSNQSHDTAVTSGIAITTGLSVGYIIWLIRGGVLLSTMVSSLPAWHLVDPLPIVDRERDKGESDNWEDESLEEIVESQSTTEPSDQKTDPNQSEPDKALKRVDSKR